MQTRSYLTLALGLALALGAAGCSSPCQELGDRICQCAAQGQIRNNCKNNVKARVNAASPSSAEDDYCSSLLDTCPDPNGNEQTCAYMFNTCPGKVACGLALPGPGGGDGCTTVGTSSPP